MKNDKSWRGMLIKDNQGDWGVAVAAWRGMKKGEPGVSGKKLSARCHFVLIILFSCYVKGHAEGRTWCFKEYFLVI